MAFTVEEGLCWFELSDKIHDVPESIFKKNRFKFTEDIIYKIKKIILIIERIEARSAWGWGFDPIHVEMLPYKFRTYNLFPNKVEKFYENFNINDSLTLRTTFHLLKSNMLFNHAGRIFSEEACMNLFFAIEGCLRLIYRRQFNSNSFAIKQTLEHLDNVFVPSYRSMIEDAYDKRIQLVHPDSKSKRNWIPCLIADDYYENLGMAIDLIYYAVTGDVLPRNY